MKAKKFESRDHRKVNINAGAKSAEKVKASSLQILGVSYVSCVTKVVEDSNVLFPHRLETAD